MAVSFDRPVAMLEKARGDLRVVKALAGLGEIDDQVIGFHAQQAVEKSIEAVLAAREVDCPYSHDIDGLMELTQNSGIELPDELTDADYLTPFSLAQLYGANTPSGVDHGQAQRWAAAAVGWASRMVEAKPND
jgi:HEPN domain-containing protein